MQEKGEGQVWKIIATAWKVVATDWKVIYNNGLKVNKICYYPYKFKFVQTTDSRLLDKSKIIYLLSPQRAWKHNAFQWSNGKSTVFDTSTKLIRNRLQWLYNKCQSRRKSTNFESESHAHIFKSIFSSWQRILKWEKSDVTCQRI